MCASGLIDFFFAYLGKSCLRGLMFLSGGHSIQGVPEPKLFHLICTLLVLIRDAEFSRFDQIPCLISFKTPFHALFTYTGCVVVFIVSEGLTLLLFRKV